MKKKIIINESQERILRESLNKRVVKMTTEQVNLLREVHSNKGTINIVEFGSSVAKSINELFVNNSTTLPETLLNLGLDANKLKHKLLSDKIIVVDNDENDETIYRFKNKGFYKWCEKYLNDLVNPTPTSGFINQDDVAETNNSIKDDGILTEKDLSEIIRVLDAGDSEIKGEIEETTDTGSVGGSYETPFAFSANPNNPKQGRKPIMKGGSIVNTDNITNTLEIGL